MNKTNYNIYFAGGIPTARAVSLSEARRLVRQALGRHAASVKTPECEYWYPCKEAAHSARYAIDMELAADTPPSDRRALATAVISRDDGTCDCGERSDPFETGICTTCGGDLW